MSVIARRWALLIIAIAMLAACGTKGPLYIAPPDTDDGPTRRSR